MNNLEYQISISNDIINNISNHNEYILNSLSDYFGSVNDIVPRKEMERIIPIISGNSVLSIRVIDWFVTNYSKKKNVIYQFKFQNHILNQLGNVKNIVLL